MRMTQGVVGNLLNRYRAVLKKCQILNVFGTLAVVTVLCGGAGVAQAAITTDNATLTVDSGKAETLDGGKTYKVTDASRDSVNINGGKLTMEAGSTLALHASGGVTVQNGGSIDMRGTKITGATYNADGDWLAGPSMTLGKSGGSAGNLLVSSGLNLLEVKFDLQKGSLKVNEGASLVLMKGDGDYDGAPVTFGTLGGPNADVTVDIAGLVDTNDLTINSGTVNITGKGRLETDAVDMKGGVVTADALYVAGDGSSYVPRDKAGFVVDTKFTVADGTVNTKYLDVQTYANDPSLDTATLTINSGGKVNVNGDVLVKTFSGGAQAEIVVNEGHLNISGKLDVTQGKVTVDGDKGSIYFKNDTTLDVKTISSDKTKATGIILTNENNKGKGQIFVQQHRLTLVGGDKLEAAHGNVKADYLTIGNASGKMDVVGGELKVYGKQNATDANAVLIANTLSTSASGSIQLGDDGAGTFGGSTTANFHIAGAGNLGVYEDWTVGDVSLAGGSLKVQRGSLTANKLVMDATAGNTVILMDNGYLNLDSEKSLVGFLGSSGTITVGGQSPNVQLENSALYFTNGATLKASDLVTSTSAGKIALTEHGMLKTGIDKKLTLADTSDQTLDIGKGTIKTYNLDVKTGDANGKLSITGGSVSVLGNRADANGGLNAETVTLNAGNVNAGSVLNFGEAGGEGESDGLVGGKINANITATNGKVNANGGNWALASDKTVEIAAGSSLAVNAGKLDVSKGHLKADSGSTVETGKFGSLTLSLGDVTLDSNAVLNGNIKQQILNNGRVELLNSASVTDAAAYKKYTEALLQGNSTGAVLLDGDMGRFVGENDTLSDVSQNIKNADLSTVTVKASASGTDTLAGVTIIKSINATGITGATYTVVTDNGNNKSLTLAGASGGTFIETSNTTTKIDIADLTLGVGFKETKGSQDKLNVSGTLTAINGEYTVSTASGGNITKVNAQTNAKLSIQNDITSEVLVNGTGSVVNLGEHKLTTTTADTTVTGGGSLKAGSIDAKGNILVGSNSKNSTGSLIAGQMSLNGKQLFADPAWITNGKHDGTYGALVAVADFTGAAKNILDGDYYAGQASQVSFGTTDTSILSKLLTKSQVWGVQDESGITAAAYLHKPVVLSAQGSIHVDGSQTSAPAAVGNQATFAKNSLLVVNANALDGSTAAITGIAGSKASVDKDAKLHLTNAKNNHDYTILGNFDANSGISYASGGWQGVGNLLQKVTVKGSKADIETNGKLVVTIEGRSASSVLPGLDGELAGMVDEMMTKNLNNDMADNKGIRFLSRAIDGRLGNAEAAKTIEGAARMIAAGGAQQMTAAAASAATTALYSRTSFVAPVTDKAKVAALHQTSDQNWQLEEGSNAGDGLQNGVGLWIMPLYQSMNTWGLKAGEFSTGSTGGLGGVALGADYTFNDMFRMGLQFNLGGGYSKSTGDFNTTDNNFNFWGVGLYGGMTANNFGLTADVNYTSSYNKMEQELPAVMDMGSLKADVQSYAITAGLRGEYKLETSLLDLIPHVGVRYMSLNTQDYDIKSQGTVFKGDAIHQNIWTFPIGVTFSKAVTTACGWSITPQVDASVVPAAGDIKAKSKVKVAGLDSTADLSTQIMDYVTYQGGVGFDVKKDNVSFGLNYTIQAGAHTTGHGVNAVFRYEF